MPRAESKPRKRYIDDLYRVRGPTVRAMLDGFISSFNILFSFHERRMIIHRNCYGCFV